jgi:hypothetical protein
LSIRGRTYCSPITQKVNCRPAAPACRFKGEASQIKLALV